MLQIIIEDTSDADQRIDKFLRKYLPNAPLGGIFKWIRTGKIKVNSKKIDQSYRLSQGDILNFFLPEEEIHGFILAKNMEKEGGSNVSQFQLEILYEDEHLLIVNKPY